MKKAGRVSYDTPPVKSPWPGRLERMKAHQATFSNTWKRNARLLFGDDGKSNENAIAYGWALCEALTTQIYAQNPETLVEPQDPTWWDTARLFTDAVNYDFGQMGLKALGNLGLIDNMVCGYAAISETVETDKTTRYPLLPTGEEDTKAEPESVVVDDQRFVARRISPRDILFDPQGLLLDLSDHRYIALAFYPTISELREDPLFTLPKGIEHFQECSSTTRQDDGLKMGGPAVGFPRSEESDPDYRTICVWEIHDKVKNEIVYVTDDTRAEIGRTRMPVRLQIGGRKLFPVTLMALHPVADRFYPMPQIDLVANQLIMLNGLDKVIYLDATTKWRKIIASANVITQEQAALFTDPSPANALILVDRSDLTDLVGESLADVDLNRLIHQIDEPVTKKDLLVVEQLIKQEIQEVLGYGPMDRGGLPQVRTAREAVAIKDKMELRIQKMSDSVADFYRDFGQKHILFLQKMMAIPRYARILNDIGKLGVFKKFSQEDIAGDFHFVVYAGTTMPRTTEAKRASELQFFQTAAPILQAAGKDILPLLYRLSYYYDWDGVYEIAKGQKDAAKVFAQILVTFSSGQVKPEQLLEAGAALVKAVLSQEDIAQLTAQMKGGQAGSAPAAQIGPRGDPNASQTSTGTM